MPANYGRRPFQTTGYSVRVSADGCPDWKIGGITLDASVLPVNNTGAAITLVDQTLVLPGAAYLIFGTTMTRVTVATEINTATVTGSPTGGTFTLTLVANGSTQTTAGIAYNAAGSAVQSALVALSNVGANNATVTGSGPYTITFNASLGNTTLTASGASLTGGTSPGVTIATTNQGGRGGLFGPYDGAATDGRQTLTRGDAFVLDETWLDSPVPAFPNQGSAHPPVFDGGRVDKPKLVLSDGQNGVALPSGYPAGPTLSNFLAVFPRVSLVND